MVAAALPAVALAVQGREVDGEEAQAAQRHQGVDPIGGEPRAVGEHGRRQARVLDGAHLVDEAPVGGGLVVVDHEHRLQRVAPGGELAHDPLVERGGHEVILPGRDRHRAEVARLVAHRVRLQRDVLEPELPGRLDVPRQQPPFGRQPGVRGRQGERQRAAQQAAQGVVAGLPRRQRAIGQRIVDPVRAEVEEGVRLQLRGPPHARSGRGQDGQGCALHRVVPGQRLATLRCTDGTRRASRSQA